jgi:hypothetical protein
VPVQQGRVRLQRRGLYPLCIPLLGPVLEVHIRVHGHWDGRVRAQRQQLPPEQLAQSA